MILYRSIDTIPYKVFIKIIEDSTKVELISDNESNPDSDKHSTIEDILGVWEKIYTEYTKISPNSEAKKALRLEKEIEALLCKYKCIHYAVSALHFEWNYELVEMILSFGYTLSAENYYSDLDRIIRESSGIMNQINNIKKLLPTPQTKSDKQSETQVFLIDQTFAFYSNLLGYDFDFNTVSVTKVMGIQAQVDAKIKSIEKQNQQQKKR